MDENVKQRVVGALVLVALAVIFLPSLFQKDEWVDIDTASQIPPAPIALDPVIIEAPTKPVLNQVPPPEKLFQPQVVDAPPVAEPAPSDKAQSAEMLSETPAEKPRLNSAGVPVSWVVQVASFKSDASAKALTDKLGESGFSAYTQSISTDKGLFYRVFVGPFIDEQLARDAQKAIDTKYQLKSRILRFNPVSGD